MEVIMDSEEAFNMKRQFELALNSIGYSLVTEEFAYKLLAWLHHYGNHESAVINPSLVSDILIAQKKLGLQGGERVRPEVLVRLRSHIAQGKDASFMKEVFSRYNIKNLK
jgi:hypothetical protein